MATDARIGTTLSSKYRVERVLGEGGMGIVYAARHLRLDRPVAIKFLHASFAKNKSALERFFVEARAAGSLQHPNVVDVSDIDTDGEAPFMVLELLSGESLAALLARRGRLPVEEALAIVLPVLDALEAAHARGIVHRDLKPDNVFLALEAGRVVPKLLDFGIAKLRDGSAVATSTGTAMGTPMYMSPEQARGAVREIGPRSDVWAMGVLLFECLTGRYPFDFDPLAGALSYIALVVTTPPKTLRELMPDAPPSLAAAVDGALQPDVERRLAGAAAMRAVLRGEPLPSPIPATLVVSVPASGTARTLPATSGAVPGTRIESTPSPSLFRPALIGLVGLAAIGAIGVIGWALSHTATEPRRSDTASAEIAPLARPPSPAPVTPEPMQAPAETAPPSPAITAPEEEPPSVRPLRAPRRAETPTVGTVEAPSAPPPPAGHDRTETRTGAWDPDEL